MKYSIVIFPGKELQDKANSLRKRFDPKYALIPPHISLISEFEANPAEIKEISKKLEKVASHFPTIGLNILKISTFQPVENKVYLKIEPTPDLEDLHIELSSILGVEQQKDSFVPHITIGQQLTNDEHLDMYSSLRMNTFQYEEQADRFHLLYELENESWTVYETFRLGKEM
ncbi:2'-5' RNA ligase family protein [Niallia sp. 01092]|uniref:2'-5' RNA ligase family protein n=1 Tax=unclassified Niallia TaxID=2837522 RepID=UPI003FD31B8A